jgi:hypothetical protein
MINPMMGMTVRINIPMNFQTGRGSIFSGFLATGGATGWVTGCWN